MSHTNIGEEICRLRESKNMTLQELAFKSGISLPTLYAYENGKALPKLRLLYKISVALDCDYDYLVELVNNEKN